MISVTICLWSNECLLHKCGAFQGITYDTGGADIKAGGFMAGMHRDKCGAAAVAGFFQVSGPPHRAPSMHSGTSSMHLLNISSIFSQILAKLKPKHLKVVGAMAMVRNSVGAGRWDSTPFPSWMFRQWGLCSIPPCVSFLRLLRGR